MRARGHTLVLAMAAIAAVGISFGVMAGRLSVATAALGPAQVREQALWLGRSALAAGLEGKKDVATPEGKATVEVVKGVATVKLGGATATVSAESERYDATGPTPNETP